MTKIIIAALIVIVSFSVGYYYGVNAIWKVLPYVGVINIAHDTDGEKYTSLAIDPKESEFLDNEKKKYIVLRTRHVYSEEKERKNE